MKDDYTLACSALRWLHTYDPLDDYFYRHYPRFDEDRDVNGELLSVCHAALGAAYRTMYYERKRRDPYGKGNRYSAKLEAKRKAARTVVQYNTRVVSVVYGDGRIEARPADD
jgi:hypothetical protein